MTTTELHPALEDAVCIELTEEEMALAEEQATLIYQYNKGERGIPHIAEYEGKNFKKTGIPFETDGQAAEIAVAKFLGKPEAYQGFSKNKEDYKRPDLLGVVEVRHVTDPNNPLRIYEKDAKAKALNVKTYVDGSLVFIIGWKDALQHWDRGFDRERAHALKSPDTLVEAVEARLGGGKV